jgi:seryl-tRNA synthetase
MISLKMIRSSPEIVGKGISDRGADARPLELLLELDSKWREAKARADGLKAERNRFTGEIAKMKKAGKEKEALKAIAKSHELGEDIKGADMELASLEEKMSEITLTMPNIPHESVPVGKDETGNKEVRKWGETKLGSKDVLPHYEVGQLTGLIDFERGAKVAGSRFVFLRRELARLERALVYFMLENAISRGYEEYAPPYLVNPKTMQGTGQLPKFEEELYRVERDSLYLIPTAEVPLTNLYAGEILKEEQLPISVCAYSPCFRREAGNYQKDIKGILRQHQFDKVELVKFATPENSYDELERLTKDAESVLQGLGLPYRTIVLCTGDMGFAATKTYDIEVWVPSQDKYREISSCSNCSDFQARRANIRYWKAGKPEFVHTLNGSGIAVGRTMIAVMENYQDEAGIGIPKVLRDFMQCERIEFEK